MSRSVFQSNAAPKPVVPYTNITSGTKTGDESNNGVYLIVFGKNFGSGALGSTLPDRLIAARGGGGRYGPECSIADRSDRGQPRGASEPRCTGPRSSIPGVVRGDVPQSSLGYLDRTGVR